MCRTRRRIRLALAAWVISMMRAFGDRGSCQVCNWRNDNGSPTRRSSSRRNAITVPLRRSAKSTGLFGQHALVQREKIPRWRTRGTSHDRRRPSRAGRESDEALALLRDQLQKLDTLKHHLALTTTDWCRRPARPSPPSRRIMKPTRRPCCRSLLGTKPCATCKPPIKRTLPTTKWPKPNLRRWSAPRCCRQNLKRPSGRPDYGY